MSKNGEKVYEEEHVAQKVDSLFDFLYCDTARIGSFLAQFDDAGVLRQIIERESVVTGAKRGFKVGLNAGATVMGQAEQVGSIWSVGLVSKDRSPANASMTRCGRTPGPSSTIWTNEGSLCATWRQPA